MTDDRESRHAADVPAPPEQGRAQVFLPPQNLPWYRRPAGLPSALLAALLGTVCGFVFAGTMLDIFGWLQAANTGLARPDNSSCFLIASPPVVVLWSLVVSFGMPIWGPFGAAVSLITAWTAASRMSPEEEAIVLAIAALHFLFAAIFQIPRRLRQMASQPDVEPDWGG